MATTDSSRCEEGQYFPAVVGGGWDVPVGGACFQLLKPNFDEVSHHQQQQQHCSLVSDVVVPIVVEEASFPVEDKCDFPASNGQDVYSISMLSEEEDSSPKCTSQLAFLSFLEFPVPSKDQICLDPQLNCPNFIGLKLESANACSPCIVDINIEMQNGEKPKSDNRTVGSITSESLSTGVLQRQASLKSCGRFLQLLTNQDSPILNLMSREKSFNERAHDASNNRWRRYRRATLFDSRKIVLLFSILSSLGTLVLIYLTLSEAKW